MKWLFLKEKFHLLPLEKALVESNNIQTCATHFLNNN